MRSPLAAALVLLAVLGAAVPARAQAPLASCPSRSLDAPLLLAEGVRAQCTMRAGERALAKWWPPTSGGTAVIDLEGTTFDAVLDLYALNADGSLGKRIASWDHGDARAAEYLAFDVGSGGYGFSVRGYRSGDAGTVGFRVARDLPANSVAAGAQPVSLGFDGTAALGLNWRPAPLSELGSAGTTRWYALTAPRNGRMTASTCTSYGADTAITVYGPDGGVIAENDDTPLRCEGRGASYAGFPVAEGRAYLVAVRLARGDGSAETLTLGWDDTAPGASVDAGPSGVTTDRRAAFTWSSPAGDTVGFECALDGAAFGGCPEAYTGLADGEHTFRVRALDAAGNVGVAAERRWRVGSGGAAVSVAASSSSSSPRPRTVGIKTERVYGPRAARARALGLAYGGGPAARFAAGKRGTAVLKLSLAGVAPGTSVELRCERRGNGCPFTVRRVARYGGEDLAKLFRARRLAAGAVIELRVTRPNSVGRMFRWQVAKRKRPAGVALCLPPGTAEPAAC